MDFNMREHHDDRPPPGTTDLADWVRRRENARRHSMVSLPAMILGVAGSGALIWATGLFGLSRSSPIYRGWLASFEFLNFIFMGLLALLIVDFGVNDGGTYRPSLFGRLRKRRLLDFLIPFLYATVAVAWGELAVRPFYTARVSDPIYPRGPNAPSVEMLETSAAAVMLIYYAILATVLVLHLFSLRYNPVDHDAYRNHLKNVFRRR